MDDEEVKALRIELEKVKLHRDIDATKAEAKARLAEVSMGIRQDRTLTEEEDCITLPPDLADNPELKELRIELDKARLQAALKERRADIQQERDRARGFTEAEEEFESLKDDFESLQENMDEHKHETEKFTTWAKLFEKEHLEPVLSSFVRQGLHVGVNRAIDIMCKEPDFLEDLMDTSKEQAMVHINERLAAEKEEMVLLPKDLIMTTLTDLINVTDEQDKRIKALAKQVSLQQIPFNYNSRYPLPNPPNKEPKTSNTDKTK